MEQEKEYSQERDQELHLDSQEAAVAATTSTSLASILSVPEVTDSGDMCRYI